MKAELRQKEESLKKAERERGELKRLIEAKDAAVEKIRREKEELWGIVNTDKYKNIRGIE